MREIDTWLQVLGLERGATPGDIRAAYRDLAKVWHPDRFPNDERLQAKAGEELQAINQAFSGLERFIELGGELPRAPGRAAADGTGTPVVRKRNPMRDTWTVRPPLRMDTTPTKQNREWKKTLGVLGGVLLVAVALGLMIWRWPF